MTLEQAKQLKSGDIIRVPGCGDKTNRTLTESWIINDYTLGWRQEGSTSRHNWEINDIVLVKSKESIINNYQIY